MYIDGQIKHDFLEDKLTHTWMPSFHFFDLHIEYAHVWCGGLSLDEVCPLEIKDSWLQINKRAKAFIRSFEQAQINLDHVCFYDLVPEQFLLEYCSLKNEISKSVFENYEKPKNYDFLHDLSILLKKIESKKLNIKFDNLNFADSKVRRSISKIKNSSDNIIYNPWSTITGRLTTEKNSFPILTLNKELRSALSPNNDIYVELDYNSAELRVLLGLLKQDQPVEDIHAWIASNVFSDKYSRDQAKKKVFAWLYNPKATNKKLNHYFDRDKINDLFYKNDQVHTPYDRTIHVTPEKAVNYLIQSTASDLFLTSAIKISKMLEGRKSYVAFCIHDSLVIDFAKEDQPIIQKLINEFSKTKFGDFRTNFSAGKNFGALKKLI